MNKVDLRIFSAGKCYEPILVDSITWDTEMKVSSGKLSFKVLKDRFISFQEGDLVTFKLNEKNVFCGYVFTKKRSVEGIIEVLAYDQLRYFKSKDTMQLGSKNTASNVIKQLAKNYALKVGSIQETEEILEDRIEEDKTLFDIVDSALSYTKNKGGVTYVLFDDFGKLYLKSTLEMELNLCYTEAFIGDFSYSSSIDENTYNVIKVVCDGEKDKEIKAYVDKDDKTIKKWGRLQYLEKVEKPSEMKRQAALLLTQLNRKTRTLSISGAIGDLRVRAGSTIWVELNVGDLLLKQKMLVENVKHSFNESLHTMDMTLKGGEFNA